MMQNLKFFSEDLFQNIVSIIVFYVQNTKAIGFVGYRMKHVFLSLCKSIL